MATETRQGILWESGRRGLERPESTDRWGVVGVGASPHQGGFFPGNLQAGSCLITWAGKTVAKPQFYTLNPGGTDLVWAPGADGKVPLGAVQGGMTEAGEDLYIGKCKIEGKSVHGKVQPSRMGCLIPHAGGEVIASSYEVLCARTVPSNFVSLMEACKKAGSPGTSVVTRLSSVSSHSLSPLSPTKRRPLRGSSIESWRRVTMSNSSNGSPLQLSGSMQTSVSRTATATTKTRIVSPSSPMSRSLPFRTPRTLGSRTPSPRTASPIDLNFATPKSHVVSPHTPISRSPAAHTTPTPRTHIKTVSVDSVTPGSWVRKRGQGVCRLRRRL